MDKARSMIEGIKTFWNDVVSETLKCEWPSRRALTESTIVVIVTVILLSLFVGVSDRLLLTVFGLLTPSGG